MHKVIEEPVFARRSVFQKPQRAQHAFLRDRMIQVASLIRDTHRGQAEARRRDAARRRGVRSVQARTIQHQPCLGIGLLEEIRAGPPLDFIQQAVGRTRLLAV